MDCVACWWVRLNEWELSAPSRDGMVAVGEIRSKCYQYTASYPSLLLLYFILKSHFKRPIWKVGPKSMLILAEKTSQHNKNLIKSLNKIIHVKTSTTKSVTFTKCTVIKTLKTKF